MVDPTKGIGPIQNILKPQNTPGAKKAEEAKEAQRAQDSVEISDKALSLSQAEDAAQKVKVALGQNPDITLGLNPALVDQAV